MEGAPFVPFAFWLLRQFHEVLYGFWHSAAEQANQNATSIFTANGNVEENLFAWWRIENITIELVHFV